MSADVVASKYWDSLHSDLITAQYVYILYCSQATKDLKGFDFQDHVSKRFLVQPLN